MKYFFHFFKTSATVAWLFALSLLISSILADAVVEVASDATSTHFNFLHAFTSETTASVLATVQAEHATIVSLKPQLVLITSPGSSSALNNDTVDGDLEKTYTFVGSNRVGFASSQWHVERDEQLADSVGTRLRSLNSSLPDVCVIVVPAASMNSLVLIALAARVNEFCASGDTVLLGFTSPLSDDLAQYVEGKTAINGQYAPRVMKEYVTFTQQTPNAQMDAAAVTNRLFVSFPVAACVENAADSTAVAAKLTTQRVSLCIGENCTSCGQSPADDDHTTTDAHESPAKRGIIVLLSCGTFFVGCALVFYVFFRNQFFMPSEATKPEKELTTGLAYVLRM